MAISLKHAFNSGKSDGVDATLVQPSNWNAEHTLQLATGKLVGRTTASTGAAEEIAVSGDLLLSSGTLDINTSVATLTGTQTLTNKTLTSPTIATPTITTSAVVPIVNGGTAASSSLTLQSTSGTGTSDSLVFKTGSQVQAMTIGTAQTVKIGTGAAAANANLYLTKEMTGSTTAYGLLSSGVVQSDVTSAAYGSLDQIGTEAASFTLGSLQHYAAFQGTIGIGSQVTNQYGFNATQNLIGAVNNYGFISALPSVTTATISNVALTSNVVTITTSAAHGYGKGQSVIVVATTNTAVNGTYTITSVPSTTTFTYALVSADIVSTADTGTAYVNTGRYNYYAAGTAPNLFNGQVQVGLGNNTGGAALSASNPAFFKAGAAATYTDIVSSGTVGNAFSSSFTGGTFAARLATTYTNATTVYINAAPTAGTNVTITNPYALYSAAGANYFGGTVTSATSTTTPLLIGGTAASSSLTLQSTSGVGTSDSIALKVGNNGATTAMTANTSGNIEFRAGTAALPAITTTGDTNTGIFFPAADTIAFAEGGSEALRIASAGQIGIGGANYGTSGQVLTSGGSAAAPSWATVSASGQLLRAPQVLTSGTSYTTPAGCNSILVEMWGGGGGGGSGTAGSSGDTASPGTGGGGGAYLRQYIAVSPSTAYTIAIGAAGSGGAARTTNPTAGANGTAGGTTSIIVGATTYSCTGGGAGSGGKLSTSGAPVTQSAAATGGTATGVSGLEISGSDAQKYVLNFTAASSPADGWGAGSSFMGAAVYPGLKGDATFAPTVVRTPGTGGGGSGSAAGTGDQTLAGAAGGAGRMLIWEFT